MNTIEQAREVARRLSDLLGDCTVAHEAVAVIDALIAERDEYAKAADDMAMAHKLERDALDQRHTDLIELVHDVHKAKGRYHSQLAMCALYDACGLPNVKPISGEKA